MIDVTDLTLDRGARRLFDHLSWRILPDAKIALVGANGAGKTTLLRLLANEIQADSGQIQRPPETTLGYLPQEVERTGGDTVIDRVLGGAATILALQKEVERLTTALELTKNNDEAQNLAAALVEAQAAYELAEGPQLLARANEALRGLGFVADVISGPMTALSGGWWMRVELARLLVARPSFLLLDEPTNHLDQVSLKWLGQFLRQYRGAWIVVSHDREFLNATVRTVAELTTSALHIHLGNYDDFLAARAARQAEQEAELRAHEGAVAKNRAFVDRFGAKASKARQAQSRLKAIERLGDAPELESRAKVMHLQWPDPARAGEVVLSAKALRKHFGEHKVIDDVTLTLQRGDKVALVGANGAGKSTLLKLLAGTLAADTGEVILGHNVTSYHFAQHQLETLDGSQTILQALAQHVPKASAQQLRKILGAFLFQGDTVFTPINVLSGGEKSRVALAKMLARPANFLLLDEPTNHLDVDSRNVLQRALTTFAGSLVIISHDLAFLAPIATRVWACSGDGTVQQHAGNIAAYMQRRPKVQTAPPTASSSNTAAVSSPSPTRNDYVERKQQRRDAQRKQRDLAACEQAIAAAERRLAAIDHDLADPQTFADTKTAKNLLAERSALADNELPELMARWEALA